MALILVFLLQDPAFDTARIDPGAPVDQVEARDVDGDGRKDLLLQSGKDIRLYRQREKGAFPAQPDQTVRLSADTFLWTIARVGSVSLLTATSRGLQRLPFRDGRFGAAEDLAIHPNLFEGQSSERKPPLFSAFAPDVDGDGRDDAFLFQRDEVWLLRQFDGAEFRLQQKLPVPVEVATMILPGPHQKIREIASIPKIALADFDGDGRVDLAYYRDEAFGVFRRREDGTFDEGGWYDLSQKRHRSRHRYLKFEVPPEVADFNGDGAADLAMAVPSKGRVLIFHMRAGRTDFRAPDHVVKIDDGWTAAIHAVDMNRDGRPDLVMAGVRKLDILGGIQAFLSKTVDLELHFYLARPGGTLPAQPDQILTFTIPFTFHATRENASMDLVFRPNLHGDYDGDGLHDVLVWQDAKTLAVYRGDAGSAVARRPSFRLAIDAPQSTAWTEPIVEDLNGDGRSDLILKYVLLGGERHVLELKLSR